MGYTKAKLFCYTDIYNYEYYIILEEFWNFYISHLSFFDLNQ